VLLSFAFGFELGNPWDISDFFRVYSAKSSQWHIKWSVQRIQFDSCFAVMIHVSDYGETSKTRFTHWIFEFCHAKSSNFLSEIGIHHHMSGSSGVDVQGLHGCNRLKFHNRPQKLQWQWKLKGLVWRNASLLEWHSIDIMQSHYSWNPPIVPGISTNLRSPLWFYFCHPFPHFFMTKRESVCKTGSNTQFSHAFLLRTQ
jgi:hypothetical protein